MLYVYYFVNSLYSPYIFNFKPLIRCFYPFSTQFKKRNIIVFQMTIKYLAIHNINILSEDAGYGTDPSMHYSTLPLEEMGELKPGHKTRHSISSSFYGVPPPSKMKLQIYMYFENIFLYNIQSLGLPQLNTCNLTQFVRSICHMSQQWKVDLECISIIFFTTFYFISFGQLLIVFALNPLIWNQFA